jgi:hypothetical protein
MTITLFHGTLGFLAVALLAIGAATVLTAIENWLRKRFTLDLHPLWHIIPGRLKVHLRWDRPGATVRFGDGREGCVFGVFDMDDSPCPIALVQRYDEDNDVSQQRPEWMELDALTAPPRRTLRETWRYLRSTGEDPS